MERRHSKRRAIRRQPALKRVEVPRVFQIRLIRGGGHALLTLLRMWKMTVFTFLRTQHPHQFLPYRRS